MFWRPLVRKTCSIWGIVRVPLPSSLWQRNYLNIRKKSRKCTPWLRSLTVAEWRVPFYSCWHSSPPALTYVTPGFKKEFISQRFPDNLNVPLQYVWGLIGMYEFNPNNDFTRTVQQLVCAEKAITQPICMNAIFLVTGFNFEQMDPVAYRLWWYYIYSSSSVS